jgi:hypothetical protein
MAVTSAEAARAQGPPSITRRSATNEGDECPIKSKSPSCLDIPTKHKETVMSSFLKMLTATAALTVSIVAASAHTGTGDISSAVKETAPTLGVAVALNPQPLPPRIIRINRGINPIWRRR